MDQSINAPGPQYATNHRRLEQPCQICERILSLCLLFLLRLLQGLLVLWLELTKLR